MSDTDNVINEFLIETHENLDHVDRDLLALERDPSAGEPLAHVFRVIHTIKGTCGFLGFSKLGSLSHAAESLLSRVRDGQMRLTPEITRTLLSVVDAIRQILSTIETSRGEGTTDCSALIATLGQLVETAAGQATPPASPPVSPTSKSAGAPERASGPPVCEPIGDILIRTGRVKARDVLAAAHEQHRGDPRHIGEILVERGAVQPRDVVEALRVQREARGASLADNSIRVDVAVLDRLMNLVGELVLVRNEMLELTANRQNVGFVAASQRLDLITTELQEGIMKTRMQPIACVWSKLPRLVHDLAAAFGKQLRIEMEGQETELDKSILEAIKDPLIHIVRNSVDHGIEIPKARTERGKPAEGRLLLRAFHEGGRSTWRSTTTAQGSTRSGSARRPSATAWCPPSTRGA